MKRILIGGTSKVFTSGNQADQTMPEFFGGFPKTDFALVKTGSSDFLISFNHNPKLYRMFLKSGGSKERSVLVRFEPDSVFPAQYTARVTKKYGLIISPGSSSSILQSDLQIHWPYKYHLNPAEPESTDPSLKDVLKSDSHARLFTLENWEDRSHQLTMVAGNKVSSISRANYSLRRKLAKLLPPSVLNVYGPLWQGSLYQKIRHRLAVLVATIEQGSWPNLREIYGNLLRSYPTAKGPIIDKHALLQDSKFSLVIENSNSIVTEKIFDAIINGSLPIYVGPNLETVGLPSDLVYQISGDSKEILEILNLTRTSEIEKRLKALFEFIESPFFWKHWEAGMVYQQMANEIIEYLSKVESCS